MLKRGRGLMVKAIAVLALVLVTMIVVDKTSPAHASDRDFTLGNSKTYYDTCGRFWPSTGSFLPERSGSLFRITWDFRLSTSELDSLNCVRTQFGQPYLELDLSLIGFAGVNDWDEYVLTSTNIPGAVHDAGWLDTASNASPGVTGIPVTNLVANTSYFFEIEWNTNSNFYPLSSQTPRVSFEWVSSHWANPLNLGEGPACAVGLGSPGWCVFGGGRAFVSGQYYTFFTGNGVRDGLPFKSFMSPPYYFPPNNGGSNPPTSGQTESGGVASYDNVIRIDGTYGLGVNLHSGPNTSFAVIGNFAEGTVVHPTCYIYGQNVGGTTLWWKVNGGYYTSFYDTVPLGWQSTIETHYGVQRCAAIVDSDGDGTPDTLDACPQIYAAEDGGCPYQLTQGPGVTTAAYKGLDHLGINNPLYQNQYIMSPDGMFVLLMQADGNLVEYGPGFKPLWASNTAGSGAGYAVVQPDGNIVLYMPDGQHAVWGNGRVGSGNNNYLVVQTDGNLVEYQQDGHTAVWGSGTNRAGYAPPAYKGGSTLGFDQGLYQNQYIRSSDGTHFVLLQPNGSLVVYGPGYHVTGAVTSATGAGYAVLQHDGNFVEYLPNGQTAVWANGKQGSGGAYMVIQSDGNFVEYQADGQHAVWGSGTSGKI